MFSFARVDDPVPQRHSRRIDVMQRFGFERDFGFAHDDVFGVSAIACIWFAEDFVAFLELRHAGNRLPISLALLVSLAIDDWQSKI